MTKYNIVIDTAKNTRDMLRMGLLQIVHEERIKERQTIIEKVKKLYKSKNAEMGYGDRQVGYEVAIDDVLKLLKREMKETKP